MEGRVGTPSVVLSDSLTFPYSTGLHVTSVSVPFPPLTCSLFYPVPSSTPPHLPTVLWVRGAVLC